MKARSIARRPGLASTSTRPWRSAYTSGCAAASAYDAATSERMSAGSSSLSTPAQSAAAIARSTRARVLPARSWVAPSATRRRGVDGRVAERRGAAAVGVADGVDVEAAVGVDDGDAAVADAERAERRAGGGRHDELDARAIGIEHLEPTAAILGHEDEAAAEADARRVAELPRPVARLADALDVRAVGGGEDGEAVVARVGDPNLGAVDREAARVVQPAGAVAALPNVSTGFSPPSAAKATTRHCSWSETKMRPSAATATPHGWSSAPPAPISATKRISWSRSCTRHAPSATASPRGASATPCGNVSSPAARPRVPMTRTTSPAADSSCRRWLA